MSDKKNVYTVLRPIGFSGRREVGEEVELTEDEAANIGSDYVALVGKTKGAGKTVKKLEAYSEKELKALAKSRDIKVPSRGKDKIIAALRAAAKAAK